MTRQRSGIEQRLEMIEKLTRDITDAKELFDLGVSEKDDAVVTEVAPDHAVGTALTLQTALGFLLTSVTISAVPPLRDAGGWPLAFGVLALGPAVGIVAMRRLQRVRSATMH